MCHLGVDVGLCGADVSAMCLPDVCKGPDQSLVPLLSWPYQHFPASPEVSSRHLCSLSSIEALSGKHTKSLQKQGHFALVLLLHGNIKPPLVWLWLCISHCATYHEAIIHHCECILSVNEFFMYDLRFNLIM